MGTGSSGGDDISDNLAVLSIAKWVSGRSLVWLARYGAGAIFVLLSLFTRLRD